MASGQCPSVPCLVPDTGTVPQAAPCSKHLLALPCCCRQDLCHVRVPPEAIIKPHQCELATLICCQVTGNQSKALTQINDFRAEPKIFSALIRKLL